MSAPIMSRTSRKLAKSYIHAPRTSPFSHMTIGQTFNKMAELNPDKEMYVFYADKERKTYRQVQEEVRFRTLMMVEKVS